MREEHEYDGAGVMGLFIGLLIIFYVLRAIFREADNTK